MTTLKINPLIISPELILKNRLRSFGLFLKNNYGPATLIAKAVRALVHLSSFRVELRTHTTTRGPANILYLIVKVFGIKVGVTYNINDEQLTRMIGGLKTTSNSKIIEVK